MSETMRRPNNNPHLRELASAATLWVERPREPRVVRAARIPALPEDTPEAVYYDMDMEEVRLKEGDYLYFDEAGNCVGFSGRALFEKDYMPALAQPPAPSREEYLKGLERVADEARRLHLSYRANPHTWPFRPADLIAALDSIPPAPSREAPSDTAAAVVEAAVEETKAWDAWNETTGDPATDAAYQAYNAARERREAAARAHLARAGDGGTGGGGGEVERG